MKLFKAVFAKTKAPECIMHTLQPQRENDIFCVSCHGEVEVASQHYRLGEVLAKAPKAQSTFFCGKLGPQSTLQHQVKSW